MEDYNFKVFYTDSFDLEVLTLLNLDNYCVLGYNYITYHKKRSKGYIREFLSPYELQAIYLNLKQFKEMLNIETKEENKMSTFTKDDLKTGHLVVSREGGEYVVFKDSANAHNTHKSVMVNLNEDYNWATLEDYDDTLKYLEDTEYDIMEVYLQSHPYSFVHEYEADKRQLLWKREEKSEKDLQIEELQATITQAQEQISKLKEIK